MKTEHTPGPWVLGDSDLYCSSLSVHCGTRQGHTTICRMVSLEYGIGIGEVEANCRLISAAPELLEALHAILENDGGEGSKCFDAIRLFDAREEARAAIAKATGEQQ